MRAIFLPLLLVGLTPASAVSPLVPERHQPIVAGIVAAGLSEYHYRGQPLDDSLSRCWLDAYLGDLDPRRTTFTAEDLESFARYETRLDDLVKGSPPDLSPAWIIYERWRRRAGERVAWTRQALQQAPDLDDAETLLLDRDEAPWPADDAALREVWRVELEDDWLRLELDETAAEDIPGRLGTRVDRLEDDLAQTEPADILELYLSSLAGCFDPHSTYFAPISADDFAISTQGSLEGIGASLVEDGDLIQVRDVIAGGPAARSGEIKPDDHIVAVAQGQGEWTDVVGMRLDHVVQLIRGPKGTTVRLGIIPGGSADMSQRKDVVLERDRIDLEAVDPTVEVREVTGPQGPVRVAVVEVPAFVGEVDADQGQPRPSTTQQVRALLQAHADVDAVVIDLRENGGGVLDEAVGMTGLFIDRGPVVRIRDGRGKVEQIDDEEAGTAWDGPLVVLTSPYSASASEILAGALQDYGRALVVGASTTYGKGSVQTVLPLDEILGGILRDTSGRDLAGALKLTFSQYYLPSGRSTQAEGVPSDVVLPSPAEGRAIREADRPHALPPSAIPAARFPRDGHLQALLPTLRERSAARVAADPRFAAIQGWLAELEAIEAETTVSLQRAQRQAELERRKARRDELLGALPDDADPVLDEALAVAADLLQLG